MTKFRKDLIFKEKTVVHCDSEAHAMELLEWAKINNINWSGGYENNCWSRHKEDTCYDLFDDDYGNIKDYRYNILEYKDVIILRGKDKCYKVKVEGDFYPCSFIDLKNDKYIKIHTGE